jgi:hypothetical protein
MAKVLAIVKEKFQEFPMDAMNFDEQGRGAGAANMGKRHTPMRVQLNLPPVELGPPTGRFLAYTVAFDPPGSPGHRNMAKMLASSLVRTCFDGDVVIFRNSPEPIFRVQRKGVEEYFIETPELEGLQGAEFSWCWKYLVRNLLPVERYERVVFLDADSLVLRNMDHLLEGRWDIAYQPEMGLNMSGGQFSCFLSAEELTGLKRAGINSGTLAVRGEIFREVMAEWERIDVGETPRERHCSDQGSWNRLVLDAEARCRSGLAEKPWRCRPFERGEVQFPMHLEPQFKQYSTAAVVHCLGGDTRVKLRFMFGLYMNTFFFDDAGVMLNLLDM